KDYTAAADKFGAARKLMPDNIDALTGLTKAEQGRERVAAEARKKAQDDERTKTFQRLLRDGQNNLAQKHYDAAVRHPTQALKPNPGDPAATKALQAAEKGRADAAKTADQLAEAKKKAEAYQKAMSDGRLALQGKHYDAAIQAFEQAQKLLPGDQASLNFAQ